MIVRPLFVGALLTFVACGSDPSDDDVTNNPPLPTFDTGTPVVAEGINPIGVAPCFDGAVDTAGNLVDFVEPGTGDLEPPLLILNFVSEAFLQTGDVTETCGAVATFEPVESGLLAPVDHFDNEDAAPMHQAYTLRLSVDPADSNCPQVVDPTLFGANAEGLLGPFDGALMGYGFAANGSNAQLTAATAGIQLTPNSHHHYVALRDVNGDFLGRGSCLGAAFEFDDVTGDLVFDPANPQNLLGLDITAVPPASVIGPSYIRSAPVAYLNLNLLADDLSN